MSTAPSATSAADDRRAHWSGVYRGRPVDQASWHQDHPTPSLAMIEASGLGKEARILDVGGGASRLVDHLMDAGYSNVGVLDVAPEALEMARDRLRDRAGGVEWFAGDVLDFRSPHAWDIWHDRAVLHFLTEPADQARYRDVMLASLADGGQAVIAAFGPDGPRTCSRLPVVRYDASELAEVLGPAMRLVDSHLEVHTTPAGGSQQFLFARFARVA